MTSTLIHRARLVWNTLAGQMAGWPVNAIGYADLFRHTCGHHYILDAGGSAQSPHVGAKPGPCLLPQQDHGAKLQPKEVEQGHEAGLRRQRAIA